MPTEDYNDWPVIQPHYIYPKLKLTERFIIANVYRKCWKSTVNSAKLKRNEKAYCKLYFKEIHSRYYKRVIKGPPFVTTSRLVLNFLISKANENLRAVLLAFRPYNLTVFTNAIRSQIELNALLNYFINDPDYHKEHLLFNEDRSKLKEQEAQGKQTVKNINTLVQKLDEEPLHYSSEYHKLSLLLHPNPSAIKFYAQAEPDPMSGSLNLYRPKLKFYFDKTIENTPHSEKWFQGYLWLFFSMMEHFLLLVDQLNNDFFVSKSEEEQFSTVAQLHYLSINEKAILKAANEALRRGEPPEEAVKKLYKEILSKKTGNSATKF